MRNALIALLALCLSSCYVTIQREQDGESIALDEIISTVEDLVEKRKKEKEKEKVEQPDITLTETTPLVDKTPVTHQRTKFHHTQTDGPDGGKSLVLCPGQSMNFKNCTSGSIKIPRHGLDEGREIYWNMRQSTKGDIQCEKDGKTYLFPASKPDSRGFVWGKC